MDFFICGVLVGWVTLYGVASWWAGKSPTIKDKDIKLEAWEKISNMLKRVAFSAKMAGSAVDVTQQMTLNYDPPIYIIVSNRKKLEEKAEATQ